MDFLLQQTISLFKKHNFQKFSLSLGQASTTRQERTVRRAVGRDKYKDRLDFSKNW